MRYFQLIAIVAAMTATCSDSLCARQASFQLMDPDGADTWVKANDISADGSVVVGSTAFEAFRWTAAGGYQRLGWLPDPFPGSFASAVSADGSIVVGGCSSTVHVEQGFRWDAIGGMVHLEPISYASGVGLSSAKAIGDNGNLIGGYSYDVIIDQPTVWNTPTTPQYIGVPGTMFTGWVSDIADNAPVVVGSSQVAPGPNDAGSVWTPGGGLTFVIPPGAASSFLNCVNSDGSTVFGSAPVGSTSWLPFRWKSTKGFEMLPTGLPNANQTDYAAIDAKGTSSVGTYRTGPSGSPTEAFYWSEATGFVPLRSYLHSRGATLYVSNDRLVPTAMSADGNVIVGYVRPTSGPSYQTPYWFMARLSPSDPQPIGVDYCGPAAPNSVGNSPTLQALGSTQLSDNDLRLSTEGLPANVFGIVLASQTQAYVPNFSGSVGTLCLGGNVGRLNRVDQIRFSGVFESMALQVDLNDVAQSLGSVAVQPGETWNFQCWYRDRGSAGSVSNMTSARSVSFQ